MSDWKSYVSLEPLLMFTSEDMVCALKDSEGEERSTYCFRTTAATGRRRLDERGVTLDLCDRLFSDYRTNFLWKWEPSLEEGFYEANDVTFEEYRAILAKQLRSREHKVFPGEGDPAAVGSEAKAADENFFDEEFIRYFADAAFCLDLRILLEEAAPEAVVELDLTELVYAGYINEEAIPNLYDHFFKLMLRRISLDYQLYGFVIEEDPRLRIRLRSRIEELTEKELIQFILLPLLSRMGFDRLRKVEFHGPGEFGSDILPFRHRTPLNTLEYYAVQAKGVSIHGSSTRPGNAAEIVNQATQALAVSFVDDLDNARKRLDKFVIVTNKTISANARHFIEEAIEGRRSLLFLNIDSLVDLVLKHHLAQYVLFSEWEQKKGV